jgi:hypothetical protein
MISNFKGNMKKLVFLICIILGGQTYAAGCNKSQIKVLKNTIQNFLNKSSSQIPKPDIINYNCYVPSPNSKPWENNVGVIFPNEITGLPFFHAKTNCRYWAHQNKGHIVCHIKR